MSRPRQATQVATGDTDVEVVACGECSEPTKINAFLRDIAQKLAQAAGEDPVPPLCPSCHAAWQKRRDAFARSERAFADEIWRRFRAACDESGPEVAMQKLRSSSRAMRNAELVARCEELVQHRKRAVPAKKGKVLDDY